MDPKDLEFEETLADSELLLKNTARSMDEDAEFSLESILAEYGSGTPAPEKAEAPAPQPVKKAPAAEAAPPQKKAEAAERHLRQPPSPESFRATAPMRSGGGGICCS